MKKIITLVVSTFFAVLLVACGSTEMSESDYFGTWEAIKAEAEGSIFTINELEALGDKSLSDFQFVIKEGGTAYVHAEGEGALVDWALSDAGITLGVMECEYEEDFLKLERNSVIVYFEKTSEDQTITEIEDDEQDSNDTDTTPTTSNGESTELSTILSAITEDYNSTIAALALEAKELYNAVGSSYSDYVDNRQLILDYYTLTQLELVALSERTSESSFDYFRAVVATIDHGDSDAIEDAMDDYYDVVYEDVHDEFYDGIYEDIYDDIYDMYYDGILDDAYDTIEYDEWSDTRSEAYEDWSDARSDIYELWSDSRSLIYEYWSDVNSELIWDDNFDVESIINDLDEPITASDDEMNSDEPESDMTDETEIDTSGTDDSSTNTEWRQFLVDYEAWIDSYIEFIEEYNDDPTNPELLVEYTELLVAMAEWSESAGELEEELSAEDAIEYAETMVRLMTKLNEAML